MKKHLYVLAVLAVALNACGPTYVVQRPAPPPPSAEPMPPPPPPESEPEATYQSFYDDLSPYGQWINDPQYGYVWLPDAGPDFKPYATNGHWVYTDEGWTWASDYNWGWATFHYGRWFFADGYGWMWVPGNEYAPAWVTWRNSDDYYGWAPMGPGVSFDMAYGGGYMPPAYSWCFVPHQYVGSPNVRNYYVNESRNVVIVNHTTVINHVTVINNNVHTRNVNYGRGPDPAEVGRYSGTSLRPVPVRVSSRPVPNGQINNGGLSVYRPRINDAPRNNNNGNMGVPPRMAPTRVSNLHDARPQNTAVYGSRPATTGYPNRDNSPVNDTRPAQPQQQSPAQPQQPAGRPDYHPNGRPANNNDRQPANNPPVNQPVTNQPVTNNRPAVQPPAGQPAMTPVTRRPGNQPQPATQHPVNNPPARPAVQQHQPAVQQHQPAVQQHQPVAQPPQQQQQQRVNPPANNRPAVTQRPQPHPPVAQPRPVSRPVTPPPPPQKQEDKKDTRPVRQ